MNVKQPTPHMYHPKDLAELLVKQLGITEGHWMLSVGFSLVAANAGPNPEEIFPSAIIPIQQIGIARADKPNPLTVDASKVNPSVKKGSVKKGLERVPTAAKKVDKPGLKRAPAKKKTPA